MNADYRSPNEGLQPDGRRAVRRGARKGQGQRPGGLRVNGEGRRENRQTALKVTLHPDGGAVAVRFQRRRRGRRVHRDIVPALPDGVSATVRRSAPVTTCVGSSDRGAVLPRVILNVASWALAAPCRGSARSRTAARWSGWGP